MLYGLIGVIALAIAVWQFIVFIGQPANSVSYTPAIVAGICLIIALACGGLFMSGRVNRNDDIHITE